MSGLLERQLQSDDPQERRMALESIIALENAHEYMDEAVKLLADDNRGVRDAASHYFIKLGSKEAAAKIAPYIQS
ncbi:MAG: hypothetical protein D6748_12400, partial [Calditrichaeota bacterium]